MTKGYSTLNASLKVIAIVDKLGLYYLDPVKSKVQRLQTDASLTYAYIYSSLAFESKH